MKVYQAGNLQIHDVSGLKTIEQLKTEFNKEEIIDITEAELAKIEANKKTEEKKSGEEALIQEKLRSWARAELVKEGKLE
jgi:hypothetical protein